MSTVGGIRESVGGAFSCRQDLNDPSMKLWLKSSTNLDTQPPTRHESVIEDLTNNFAPNIWTALVKFGFLQSIVAMARSIIYAGT
jgi:hypothetical protein